MKFHISEELSFPEGGKLILYSKSLVTKDNLLEMHTRIGKLLSEMSWVDIQEEKKDAT